MKVIYLVIGADGRISSFLDSFQLHVGFQCKSLIKKESQIANMCRRRNSNCIKDEGTGGLVTERKGDVGARGTVHSLLLC